MKLIMAKLKQDGLDATFKAITEKKFNDRDLYPFINKLDGTSVAHGANAAMVGKDMSGVQDQDGRFLVRAMAETAKSGGGWVDYKWPNPVTNMIDAKSSYVERFDDYFVGVGVYR